MGVSVSIENKINLARECDRGQTGHKSEYGTEKNEVSKRDHSCFHGVVSSRCCSASGPIPSGQCALGRENRARRAQREEREGGQKCNSPCRLSNGMKMK